MGILPAIKREGYDVKELRLIDANGRRVGGFSADIFAPRRTTPRNFDIVIEADGLHSVVRRLIFGELETEHRLAFGLVFGFDDLAGLLLGGLPQIGAFPRFGIDTIEGPVAASAVNETVACFRAGGAIANLNEPASKA